LEKAVEIFARNLKEKHKTRLNLDKIQTLDDLTEAINKASKAWSDQKRFFPKAQDKIRSFLAQTRYYEHLLSVIPSESVYTSVFCGAIKALVQVCGCSIYPSYSTLTPNPE
jgi:hypothetical protein